MIFLAILALTCAVAVAARDGIKAHPVVAYACVAALVLAFEVSSPATLPRPLFDALFFLIQKCMLAMALFMVVMALGALPSHNAIRSRLMPIRAELSIMGCIASVGHIVSNGLLHGGVFVSNGVGNVLFLCVALAAAVLLCVLGVTSVRVVKARMNARTWQRIQKGAYVFMALLFLHIMLILAPSALGGGAAAQEGVAVYAILFGVYAIARIRRAFLDGATRR